MSPEQRRAGRDALWQAMVALTETLNDATVFGQRKALTTSARRIRRLALNTASLADAIVILSEDARS